MKQIKVTFNGGEGFIAEISKVKREYTKYDQAERMDKIGMCHIQDKAEDLYYHFWMICNDLGIIDPH